ncbi:type IV secretion system protein VirB10 [Steroidobacter flavus]|uniref:Type IV secretion system protein VirB10 n=1 Tax=Steroidobacter flavus TaxID=1842136 RepID=A0ABV8SVT6_9GAMM
MSGWSRLIRGLEVFRRDRDGVASDEDREQDTIPGDRGVSPTQRALSVQTRVTNLVALGLGALVGTTFLVWYYQHALSRPRAAAPTNDRTVSAAPTLPPLGRIDPPLIERVLGPPPALPEETSFDEDAASVLFRDVRDRTSSTGMPPARSRTPDRRLSGEAFVAASTPMPLAASVDPAARAMPAFGMPGSAATPASGGELAERLTPTVLPAAQARVLPTRRLLLPKGAFLDCTLETAIDSSLPGMTTCVTATDTFGADGSVVLLERGSKLIGETRGEVRAGTNRVFVLWTEARTPTGVVVTLASAGTDALGRSGLPGAVDRHFWDRFGAAILVSVIDGAVQAAVQREARGTSITVNPAGSSDIMTEVLESTIHIPPTVTLANGERIAVLVARDLDFRSVYELRPTSDR